MPPDSPRVNSIRIKKPEFKRVKKMKSLILKFFRLNKPILYAVTRLTTLLGGVYIKPNQPWDQLSILVDNPLIKTLITQLTSYL